MLLLAPIVVMVAMGYVADALWPTLVQDHPLRAARPSAPATATSSWSPAGWPSGPTTWWARLRLLAPDPFLFAIGWVYGPAAIRWMERRTPTGGRVMRTLERWFARWGHPLVVIIPNNYVCLIAGAAQMSPCDVRLPRRDRHRRAIVLLRIVGDVFSGPIDTCSAGSGQYRVPLLVVSTASSRWPWPRELRRGRQELEELQELEE